METVKPEFEICSSIKKLSTWKCASTSEQRVNNGSMPERQRIEKERESYRYNLEARSSGKKPLQDSRTWGAEKAVKKPLLLGCSTSKAVVCNSEVEELNERLRILEEETETMKQELFESAQERKKLMNDIYQQFQMLEIDPRYLVAREFKSTDENTSVNSSQDERMGTSLLDILHQDPHPSLVTRNLRANALALLM
ncbi:uncharacterized protein LOC110756230 isoform X1 [Prunus avium]|uniref:Uncharacterized protein LOC110756230 isoform X1 n=1 Tax=Prunus avium TaxID=42229 RepID=A0A6P5SBP9_PRUAV|nr:uncharacterized protein LOC110756230 isoform X1 [Prunus avium]